MPRARVDGVVVQHAADVQEDHLDRHRARSPRPRPVSDLLAASAPRTSRRPCAPRPSGSRIAPRGNRMPRSRRDPDAPRSPRTSLASPRRGRDGNTSSPTIPPAAISSINASGTVSLPRHIPGWASTHTPPASPISRRASDRRERVLRDVGEAVVGDVAVERLLLIRDDPGLDHRLRRCAAWRSRSPSASSQDPFERDVEAELAELLDDHLAAPETGGRESQQLRLDRRVVRVDPVPEDVEARAVVLGRELDPRHEVEPELARGRRGLLETVERVVIGEGDAREVRCAASIITSAGASVPSERFEWLWRSYPGIAGRVSDSDRGRPRARRAGASGARTTSSRPISATVRQPVSAIAFSTSARKMSEHTRDAVLALRRETPGGRPAHHDRGRAERDRLQHVGPSPHAAVHQDRDAPVDRLDHLGQRVERRRARIELPPTVVRHHDRLGAVLDRQPRVLGREDPLHQDREPGACSRMNVEVLPRHVRLVGVVGSARRLPNGITNPLRVSRCRRPATGKSTVQQIASIAGRDHAPEHVRRSACDPRTDTAATTSARRSPPRSPRDRRPPSTRPRGSCRLGRRRGRCLVRRPDAPSPDTPTARPAPGTRRGVPRSSVEGSGKPDPRRNRGRSTHRSNALRFSSSVRSSPAPPA